MTSLSVSIYRSLLRMCRQKDPQFQKYLQSGLMTFQETPFPCFQFKYIRDNSVSIVYGPYSQETANLLSFCKYKIRTNKPSKYSMDKLFYTHRELPEFLKAMERLRIETELKKTQPVKNISNRKSNSTSYGTSFF